MNFACYVFLLIHILHATFFADSYLFLSGQTSSKFLSMQGIRLQLWSGWRTQKLPLLITRWE